MVLESFKVQPNQKKVDGNEIEDKMERVTERTLEALYARVESLERLSSRDSLGNSQGQEVFIFIGI